MCTALLLNEIFYSMKFQMDFSHTLRPTWKIGIAHKVVIIIIILHGSKVYVTMIQNSQNTKFHPTPTIYLRQNK